MGGGLECLHRLGRRPPGVQQVDGGRAGVGVRVSGTDRESRAELGDRGRAQELVVRGWDGTVAGFMRMTRDRPARRPWGPGRGRRGRAPWEVDGGGDEVLAGHVAGVPSTAAAAVDFVTVVAGLHRPWRQSDSLHPVVPDSWIRVVVLVVVGQ